MNNYKFDEIVKNKAAERAVQKIKKFRKAVWEAAHELAGAGSNPRYDRTFSDTDEYGRAAPFPMATILNILLSKDSDKGWPKIIWEKEEAAVAEELLRQLDFVQQAMLAKPPTGDGPTTEPIKEKTDDGA